MCDMCRGVQRQIERVQVPTQVALFLSFSLLGAQFVSAVSVSGAG
jgi:hypothetical protein